MFDVNFQLLWFFPAYNVIGFQFKIEIEMGAFDSEIMGSTVKIYIYIYILISKKLYRKYDLFANYPQNVRRILLVWKIYIYLLQALQINSDYVINILLIKQLFINNSK